VSYDDQFIPGDGLVPTVTRCPAADEWRSITFYAPRIRARFASPMVNRQNFGFSSVDGWCMRRVAAGRKPICFTCSYRKTWVDRVEAAGGTVRAERVPWGRARLLSATLGGRIGEVFDIPALTADYDAYLADVSRGVRSAIAAELLRIASMDLTAFLEFEVTGGQRRMAASLARCGLLLGYPVASTAALIRVDLGLPGGHLAQRRVAEVQRA
jgi:hypothetical protein